MIPRGHEQFPVEAAAPVMSQCHQRARWLVSVVDRGSAVGLFARFGSFFEDQVPSPGLRTVDL